MRKYSFWYFWRQAFQGLFRNGVMTFASVAVLTSCLVVLGSFALLVFNINTNIESLGELNEIRVFVDTTRSPVLPGSDTTGISNAAPDQSAQDTDTAASDTNVPEAGAETEPTVQDTADEESKAITAPDWQDAPTATTMTVDEIVTLLGDLGTRAAQMNDFTDLAAVLPMRDALQTDLRTAQAQIYYMEAGEQRDALEQTFFSVQSSCNTAMTRLAGLMELKGKIEGLGVRASLISRSSALEQQKEKYKDYPEFFESLTENPYPDAFQITYDSMEQADTLEYDLNHLDGRIYRVVYRADVTESIQSVRSVLVLVFTWFLVILFVVSFFVIVNTVKLAVYSRKEEISVMSYVGATHFFITVPFVFEGLVIGVFASLAAFFLQQGLYAYIANLVMQTQIITVVPFAQYRVGVLFAFLGVGIVTGVLGSCVSLRRYMKD